MGATFVPGAARRCRAHCGGARHGEAQQAGDEGVSEPLERGRKGGAHRSQKEYRNKLIFFFSKVEKSDPANAIRIRGARAPVLECRRDACVCNSSAAFSYLPLHEPVPSRLPANSPRSSRLDRRESGERRIREGHCVRRSPSLAHAACDRRSAASQVAKCSPIRRTKRETVLSATRTGERGRP